MEIQYLYHYFEKRNGPFKNLSSLKTTDAQEVLDSIKKENRGFAAKREDGYLNRRKELEQKAYEYLISTGGRPETTYPHYFVIGKCEWLRTWYEEPLSVKIPIVCLPENLMTFTYGDLFPTFSPSITDGKEYRDRIYRYEEILKIIERYGLPQDWNPEGKYGPERYVEVHFWGCVERFHAVQEPPTTKAERNQVKED